MTDKQAINESIKHWEKMIAWVETQDGEGNVNSDIMQKNIKQMWYSDDCPLCQKYVESEEEYECTDCPLGKKFEPCDNGLKVSAWNKVSDAGIWKDWLKHARVMLKQLESLRADIIVDEIVAVALRLEKRI